MREVEITIKLPETLVNQAKELDIDISAVALTPDLVDLIKARITRKLAWKELIDAAETLSGTLTEAEIDAELARAKAERIAQHGNKPQ